MNYNPKISVIIPTYNEEKLIKDTLIAVKQQNCDLTYEVIVVDGQSTDNTVSIAENFAKVTGSNVRIVIDENDMQSPLIGALTGFERAYGEYSLLLPCDTPLVSRDILLLLLELRINKNAVIPRWSNGYIEPLQAVYCTKPTVEAAKKTLNAGKADMRSMVDELRTVRYISTLVLQQLDPGLRTFFNINTPLDLRKAESMSSQLKKPKFR